MMVISMYTKVLLIISLSEVKKFLLICGHLKKFQDHNNDYLKKKLCISVEFMVLPKLIIKQVKISSHLKNICVKTK